jgi:hypothetical protein
MSARVYRLRHSVAACTKRTGEVRLPAGTLVRRGFTAAGAAHFLASPDGATWTAYYTHDTLELDEAPVARVAPADSGD